MNIENHPTLWKPGQSGNPSGKPKEVAHVKELARQWTVEAIGTLGAIMTDKREKASARVAAANALLDRGYGRAPLTFEDAQEQPVDLREAARRIAFIMNGAILRGDVIDAEVVEVSAVDGDALALAGAVVESREKVQERKTRAAKKALQASIDTKKAVRDKRTARLAAMDMSEKAVAKREYFRERYQRKAREERALQRDEPTPIA